MDMNITTPIEGIEQFFSLAKKNYPKAFADDAENVWQLVEAFPISGCNPAYECDLVLQEYRSTERRSYTYWSCKIDISELSTTPERRH